MGNGLGYSKDELHKMIFLDLVHPDDIGATIKAVEDLAQNKKVINFVNRYRCKDGSYKFIEWRSTPNGDLIYSAARDITHRNEMEKILNDKKEQFELAIKGSNDGIWDWDIRTNEMYISPKWKEQLGYNEDELKSKYEAFQNLICDYDKDLVNKKRFSI